jgi:DDE superfamily endonuclease
MGALIKLDMAQDMENRDENDKKKQGRGLNGAKYVVQVLQGPLKEFVEELEDERGHDVLVVEDGAPRHMSKLASKARSELGIKKLTHPPKSPDLNLIEPLWYILKN